MHDFVTLCIDHMEYISSLSYAELLNIGTFVMWYQKLHLLISSAILSEKPLKY